MEQYQYLQEECGVESETVREMLQRKVLKYDDIAQEFRKWLEVRKFDDGLSVNGYTAEKLHEIAPHLSGIGVYIMLTSLRDEPEKAQESIEEGFMEL